VIYHGISEKGTVVNYLTVDVYKEFKCSADACSNTCCVGWRVEIDKETYEKMIEKEEQLGVLAKEWLDDTRGRVSVRLADHKRCPMLTDNNLCRVVLKLGPEYLSTVCTMYPRQFHQYGENLEGYLFMSCPEVISMLMEKDAVEFDTGQDQRTMSEYPHLRLYLFECTVRASMVEILQSMPQISLNTRLFTAFTVLEEGIRMYREDQLDGEAFEKEVSLYAQEAILWGVETRIGQLVDGRKQYQFLRQLFFIMQQYTQAESQRFAKLIRQAELYFSECGMEQYLSDVQAFKENCRAEYGRFYTNYWVYRIFSYMITIPEYEKSKEKFIYTAVEFAMIQMILLADFVKQGGRIDREDYIYIISCISRVAEHSSKFETDLLKHIHEKNLASGAGVLLMTIL